MATIGKASSRKTVMRIANCTDKYASVTENRLGLRHRNLTHVHQRIERLWKTLAGSDFRVHRQRLHCACHESFSSAWAENGNRMTSLIFPKGRDHDGKPQGVIAVIMCKEYIVD